MFHHALVAFSVLLQRSMSLFISFPVEGHLGFVLQFSAVMKKVAMNIHIEVLRSEHKDLFHLGEDGRARWEKTEERDGRRPVLSAYLQETAKLPPVRPHESTLPPVMHDSSPISTHAWYCQVFF